MLLQQQHHPSIRPLSSPQSRSCWASRAQPAAKRIVYGATDLLAGEQFLQQLSALGVKSGAAPAPA